MVHDRPARFRGNGRAKSARDDNTGDQRAKLAGDADRYQVGYHAARAELIERVGGFQRKNHPQKKGDEHHQRQRVISRAQYLQHYLSQAHTPPAKGLKHEVCRARPR